MISNRKDEHIKYAMQEEIIKNDFDDIVIEHNSIPKYNLDMINLETSFLGFKVKNPVYINAMTGGSKQALLINEKLAIYAKKFELPLVLGSSSAFLKHEELIESYEIVRKIYPDCLLVSNISAQTTVSNAKKAILKLNADALSVHLNLIQELVMEEGDREFLNLKENLIAIKNEIKVPVIIKEVGFGMSKETLKELEEIGFSHIDVSGSGGTNFARIERKRTGSADMTFENIGISTVKSLENAKNIKANIYASGGIRNALDVFKALYLGATAVGLSGFFLRLTKLSDEKAFAEIEKLLLNIKKAFLIYGYKDIKELKNRGNHG